MAQQDASPKSSKIMKWVLGLLAVATGGQAADLAGLELDTASLERLGIVGAFALIAYLHLVWLPMVVDMAQRMKRAFPDPVVEPTAAPSDAAAAAVPKPVAKHETGPLRVLRE